MAYITLYKKGGCFNAPVLTCQAVVMINWLFSYLDSIKQIV